jgi:(p)ppGpp synthase/HD superfamily hydrolase
MNEALLIKAKALAYKQHENQLYDKIDNIPYTYHLEQVVEILRPYGQKAMIIGYLHDIVEDTDIEIEKIKKLFNLFIAECVYLVTDEMGQTRIIRKEKTNLKLSQAINELELALIVKAADRLANMRESFKTKNTKYFNRYIQEYPAFRKAVFRENLAPEIWNELDALVNKKL